MKKRDKIIGLIGMIINLLLIVDSLYWFYRYNFTTGILFLIMTPNWVLLTSAYLGLVGFYISLLLYKGGIKLWLFGVLTLLIWLIVFGIYWF